MARTKRMPSTIPSKARRTWSKVQPKRRRGPSDPRAAKGGARARRGEGETLRGVDYFGHNKVDLYERARTLRIPGRSRMSKKELARAIARARH